MAGASKDTDLLILAEADSTNARAAERLRSANGPFWILARKQTAGRGRRGRSWQVPEGNFAASWGGWPRLPEAELARVSFAAALACHDALRTVATPLSDRLRLKWPNDILLDGQKLAGILLETVRNGERIGVVAGIGINLVSAPPPDLLEPGAVPAIALSATGFTVTSDALLPELSAAFARRLEQLEAGGFPTIRADWKARAAGLGQPVTARLANATHRGIFADIDAEGALLLDTAAGRLVLPAADVYL